MKCEILSVSGCSFKGLSVLVIPRHWTIFFKHNRATVSASNKVLEKRELKVFVTILSSSKLSGMLRG